MPIPVRQLRTIGTWSVQDAGYAKKRAKSAKMRRTRRLDHDRVRLLSASRRPQQGRRRERERKAFPQGPVSEMNNITASRAVAGARRGGMRAGAQHAVRPVHLVPCRGLEIAQLIGLRGCHYRGSLHKLSRTVASVRPSHWNHCCNKQQAQKGCEPGPPRPVRRCRTATGRGTHAALALLGFFHAAHNVSLRRAEYGCLLQARQPVSQPEEVLGELHRGQQKSNGVDYVLPILHGLMNATWVANSVSTIDAVRTSSPVIHVCL